WYPESTRHSRLKIKDRQIPVLMPHGRAERELEINRDCRRDCESLNRRNASWIDVHRDKRTPEIGGHNRDQDDQTEKRLRETGVKDSNLIFQHRDPQATENPLQNYAGDGDQAERLDRLSIFDSP